MSLASPPAEPGKRQVSPGHYQGLQYDSKIRFISYWHQIEAVLRHAPERVLEIGIGNGFVARHLRETGLRVETLDFDPELAPRVAGSAESLPFRDGSFDLVLCCEVLEHMPYDRVPAALEEFRRVSSRHIVISVPDVTPCIRLLLPIPALREVEMLLPSFWRRAPRYVSCPQEHWWELGVAGYSPRRFRDTLERTGASLLRDYRIFEDPFHHFFEVQV